MCLFLKFYFKVQISSLSVVSLWSLVAELILLHLVVRKQRDFLSSVRCLLCLQHYIIRYNVGIAWIVALKVSKCPPCTQPNVIIR